MMVFQKSFHHLEIRRSEFLTSLAARPRVAKHGADCGQPEAARAKAMADTTALPWLALRPWGARKVGKMQKWLRKSLERWVL